MSETIQIIIGIGILICLIVLSRRFMAWRIRRAFIMIVADLKEIEASGIEPESIKKICGINAANLFDLIS